MERGGSTHPQNVEAIRHQKSSKNSKYLRIIAQVCKVFFMTFILKYGLGQFDVGTDLLNGSNFLNGQYGLSLYFIAPLRSENPEAYGKNYIFGILCLAFVWCGGVLRTLQIAWDSNWRDLSLWWRAMKVLFLVCVAVVWPMLTVLL